MCGSETGAAANGVAAAEPAMIEPSGKITKAIPSEQVVCDRGLAIGHGLDAAVERREPGDSQMGSPLEPPVFRYEEV